MDHRKLFAGLAAAVLASAVAGSALAQDASPAASDAAGGGYKIGMTNTHVGNGWREEMRCSILAEAAKSGQVADVLEFHQESDAAGQQASIRDFINAGVDAIIVNPHDATALDQAIKEATDAGIVVVSVDQSVTAPTAYSITNDHEQYAYLGAKWLFDHLGEGDVYYMRGFAGAGADDERNTGFQKALAEHPGIKVIQEDFTKWDFPEGTRLMLDFLASGIPLDGVWTSGVDFVIPRAFVDSGAPLVPVVGADTAEFIRQLVGPKAIPGFTGAGVTNPASIGGAGMALALKILNGELPKVPADAASAVYHITPVLFENATEEGKAALEKALDPDLPQTWPVGITVPEWTHYDKAELLACGGRAIGESKS